MQLPGAPRMYNRPSVDVTWIAAAPARGARPDEAALRRYFSVRPRTGLFRGHGIPENLWVVPQHMKPSNGFHAVASKSVAIQSGSIVDRLPYPPMQLTGDIEASVKNIGVSLFPGDILVVSVHASLTGVDDHTDTKVLLQRLKSIRAPKQVPEIDALIRESLALALGDRDLDRESLTYDDFFALYVQLPVAREFFDHHLDDVRPEVVALLIGASDPKSLNEDLLDRVQDASAELNTKAVAELMLLNRQGLILLRPSGNYKGPHPDRFNRACDLAELAVFTRWFLRDSHQFSTSHPMLAEFIARRIEQWIEYPQLSFDTSVSQTLTWSAFIEQFFLVDRLRAWRKLAEPVPEPIARAVASGTGDWWAPDLLTALLQSEREQT